MEVKFYFSMLAPLFQLRTRFALVLAMKKQIIVLKKNSSIVFEMMQQRANQQNECSIPHR